MSKRNITFTKPSEPSFLRKLKEQVGYKEGPSIDTKREALDIATEADFEDTAEEQPTVVVLQPGDLSADEATKIKEQLKKESEETPADLSVPIVFKAPSKTNQEDSTLKPHKRPSSSQKSPKKSKKPRSKVPLSFDEDENDD